MRTALCSLLVVLGASSVVASSGVRAGARYAPDSSKLGGAGGLPKWKPTYRMNESTAHMPCNVSGVYNPAEAARWGIADFDWSDGKLLWANAKPMNTEELLVQQADMVKREGTSTVVWVYRNLVKALPWYTSVREKLDDPAYSGFFLKFKKGGFFPNGSYHVPACTGSKCSGFYHDQDQTPEHPHGDGSCTDPCDCGDQPCGEYLWDHRNGSMLRDFLINEFVLGPTGLGHESISGFYLDDGWTNKPEPIAPWMPKIGFCSHNSYGGPTEEDRWCVEDMGLDKDDVQNIYSNWSLTIQQVHQAIIDNGGFSWQQFWGTTNDPTDSDKCASFIRDNCRAGSEAQTSAMMYSWNHGGSSLALEHEDFDLASFLLTRGDYAWIGYSWVGCAEGDMPSGSAGKGPYILPNSTQVDYGTPTGFCTESSPNVFTRDWTKATVTLNCSDFEASIRMK